MNAKTCSLVVPVLAVFLLFPAPARSASQTVTEALALVKQMQPDQCALQKVRGKLLVAHQSHDQPTLDTLAPQMDALNARLKPSVDKLRELTAVIKNNLEDQAAFTTAQVQAASCN